MQYNHHDRAIKSSIVRISPLKEMLMLGNVSVIRGLIATKALKAKGWSAKGFIKNLRISAERMDRKTFLLRVPLVAIGAQKGYFIS